MSVNLKLEFHLPASPAKVMDLLLDVKELRRWSGEEAVVDRKTGGAVSLFGRITGEITKLSDTELVYTWKDKEWGEGAAASEVKYRLEKDREGTKIFLEHNNLPGQDVADDVSDEWDDQMFGLMEEYLWATMKK